MSYPFDLVIKNARIIDGTGNPVYRGDIGISDGRIALIDDGISSAKAKSLVNAGGLTASPGFFDTHSHDDISLLVKPVCEEKLLQGVTTTVIGNCGCSLAPVSDDFKTDMMNMLAVLGGRYLPEEYLGIHSFGEFLKLAEASRPAIHVLPLVGHSTLRIAVLGSANRNPTADELEMMKKLTAEAMKDGAFGMSTGLIYAPGNYAGTDEIIELAKVVSRFHGIYTSHIRNEGDHVIPALTEAIRIGKEAALPIHISHHKVMGRNNWGRSVETLALMDEARARAVEVTCDQYPYRASSTFLAAVLPPGILADGPEAFSEKLKEREVRDAVKLEIKTGNADNWENLIKDAGFENIRIAASPNHPDYIGRSIGEIARTNGKDPFDVIFDLVVEETRETIIILSTMNDGDIRRIMKHSFTMIGTDGIPAFGISRVHPRLTGTFPRILGRFARDRGVLRLEEAVRKMTSLPAQTFRVKKKGLLKEGFDADIVIFDPDTILDRSTYDDPYQKPEGISHVLVDGKITAEDGEWAGIASGKVLRHTGCSEGR